MMFGDGLAIRDELDNVFMDYRDESQVTPKLTADLKEPFKLEGMQRIDETPVHKAVEKPS